MGDRPDPRREAVRILDRVNRSGAYASVLLANAEPRFRDRRDRALLHAMVLGVLRRRSALDHVLQGISSRPLDRLTPGILEALRVGAFLLTCMDRVPSFAVLDVLAGVAREIGGGGAAGFVNGVLRRLDREKERRAVPEPAPGDLDGLARFHGHPAWMFRRMAARLGEERAVERMKANNRPARTVVHANRRKGDLEDLARRLAAEGIETVPARYVRSALVVKKGAVQGSETFREGRFWIQDEASRLLPALFGETVSGRVLDACAAPGGKTMVLAESAEEGTEIVAVDRNRSRLEKVKRNVERLGFQGIRTVEGDMLGEPAPVEGMFDRVLVDAPCSGTGTLRRRPEIRWRLREEDLPALAGRQGKILAAAAALLKPGGVLVYGVCSTEPEEGEGVVDRFLQEHAGFEAEDPRPFLPEKCGSWIGNDDCLRTSPVDGVDGFFGARLVRRS